MIKSAHFFLIKTNYSAEDYAQLYLVEIVKLHGAPVYTISNRGNQFSAHFWKSFQIGLGTKVCLSNAFHPYTDGKTERTTQTLQDMLQTGVFYYGGGWYDHIPLIEFVYNYSYTLALA